MWTYEEQKIVWVVIRIQGLRCWGRAVCWYVLWAGIFTGCRRLSAGRIAKSDLPLCSVIAQIGQQQRRVHGEADSVVDMEVPGGRCSPVIVTAPGMRSGLPIQRAGSLLITRISGPAPTGRAGGGKKLQWSQTSAGHCSVTGHPTFRCTGGNIIPPVPRCWLPHTSEHGTPQPGAPALPQAGQQQAEPHFSRSPQVFGFPPRDLHLELFLKRHLTSVRADRQCPNRIRMPPSWRRLRQPAGISGKPLTPSSAVVRNRCKNSGVNENRVVLLQPSGVSSDKVWSCKRKDHVIGNTELLGQRHKNNLGIISVQEDARTGRTPISSTLETRKKRNEKCIDLVFEPGIFRS